MKKIEFTMDTCMVENLLEKVEKINKRFDKYNLPRIEVTVGENRHWEGISYKFGQPFYSVSDVSDVVVYSNFEQTNIAGETVNFEGTTEFIEVGKEETKTVKTQNEFINDYLMNNSCVCDKCKKNIQRGKYIVFSKDVDEVKSREDFYIFGTTCAKDFFPFDVESYIDRIDKFFNSITEEMAYDEDRVCRGKEYLNMYEVAFAVGVVTNGFTAIYNKETTLDDISEFFFATIDKNPSKETKYFVEKTLSKYNTPFDTLNAIEVARDYFTNKKNPSSFDFNCKQVLSADKLPFKWLRMLCTAIYFGNVGNKKLEKRNEELKEEAAKSNYVGNDGDKFDKLELTFDSTFSFETAYGFTNLIKFLDKDGNVLVWYTQKPTNELSSDGKPLNKGDKVILKGTIKGHKEYHSEKQTLITRCKIA